MNLWQEVALVAGKDLRIEARSRVVLQQVLPFGLVVLLLFAFAIDPDRDVLERVAPGLFWVTVLLSVLLAIGRSFALEAEHGAREGLRLSSIDGSSLFLGKAAAVAAQLVVLEALLTVGVVVLFEVELASIGPLVASALLATVGLASASTVYGILAVGLRVRETLLPMLILPVTAPVLLGGTRAWEASLEGVPSDAWPWVGLLAIFAVLFTGIGMLAFGTLLEES